MQKNASKLAALVFCLAVVMSVSAPRLFAQGAMSAPAGDEKAEALQRLEKMSAALNLSPAQKQQVRPIVMEEVPKLKALKSNTSLGPMQKAMQMRQIADATDAKLKPILTPQQYQTWEQMRAQERQQMMQKMENR